MPRGPNDADRIVVKHCEWCGQPTNESNPLCLTHRRELREMKRGWARYEGALRQEYKAKPWVLLEEPGPDPLNKGLRLGTPELDAMLEMGSLASGAVLKLKTRDGERYFRVRSEPKPAPKRYRGDRVPARTLAWLESVQVEAEGGA